MHLTVVGTGYVGLVSGAGFSDFGLNVICVDCDEEKIQSLKNGQIPIYEPGLEEIVRRNVANQRLHFSTDLKSAIKQSLVIFIAVGTPQGQDGAPDLSRIHQVARSIAEFMDDYKVIVTKSTVPIGTGKWIRKTIEENQSGKIKFDVVSNPEFLREGAAIEDFMRPNRVVIGSDSEQAAAIVKDIYRPLYLIETPFIVTSLETAELIKYASNAFLATKISFINEMSLLCETVGADVHHVARAMGLDRRIGSKFLHPGPGYGGSCFPKDVAALVRMGKEYNCQLNLVESVIQVNRNQRHHVIEKVVKALGIVSGKKVAIWGLAFKPNTDDVRESPAIYISRDLCEKGVFIQAFDPVAIPNAQKALDVREKIIYFKDAYAALQGVEALIIMTEWNEFRNADLAKIKKLMERPLIFDTRNIYEREKVESMGFEYYGTGR